VSLPLFVYGTLRSGGSQHARMRGAVSLGPARTRPEMTLVDLGWHPAMSRGGDTAVTGELYAVDAALLAELDEFEEVPAWYRREPIVLDDGREAMTYVLPSATGPRIAGGDWVAHLAARGG
jgi:gamma-glutamylcyclotransferase (GGCT)/AIG2-like uncharacterized protein YtfP